MERKVPGPAFHGDRRHKALSRSDHHDRRSSDRFDSEFPVQVHFHKNGEDQTYTAMAVNVSDTGLQLQNIDIPEDETRIDLSFIIPGGTMPEEYGEGKFEFKANVRSRDPEHHQAGVEFVQPMSIRLAQSVWRVLRACAVLLIFLATASVLLFKLENLYEFWFDVPIFIYSIAVGSYLLSRFLFAGFYRPPKVSTAPPPPLSVIIPVFNEEEVIGRTLTHFMEAEYPEEKFQLIAVNDGSTDGTLAEMRNLQKIYPDLVVINMEKNSGKRTALAAGIKLAKGDIIVLSDSDSFVEHDALIRLVEGFENPKVGAITGHCDVQNAWENTLTRMQAVRYFVSFRVMKAAESIFDYVSCLSGPLAAYRREVILDILDPWIHQTFLGRPATFGEDRALTNYVMKKGHRVLYDSRARTDTLVPSTYSAFFRQQLRWKRSWFRESTRALAFIFKKQPLAWLSYTTGLLLPVLGPIIVFRAIILIPIMNHTLPLIYLFGILLMSGLMSSAYLFTKRSRLWFYGVPFCFFYMFILIWQLPWAIATYWQTTWGTRDTVQ